MGESEESILGQGDLGSWDLVGSVRVEVALGVVDDLLRLVQDDVDREQTQPDPDTQALVELGALHAAYAARRDQLAAGDSRTAEAVIEELGPVLRVRRRA